MREIILNNLSSALRPESASNGRVYLEEAIEAYMPGMTLKNIYCEIALRHAVSVAAVEKAVATAIYRRESAHITPKAYIAREKERIIFSADE